MSGEFWVRIRIIGWIILLVWYLVYTVNSTFPILANQIVALSHGITGTTGTVLVLMGYYNLRKK